jgi:hypothetical protein
MPQSPFATQQVNFVERGKQDNRLPLQDKRLKFVRMSYSMHLQCFYLTMIVSHTARDKCGWVIANGGSGRVKATQ